MRTSWARWVTTGDWVTEGCGKLWKNAGILRYISILQQWIHGYRWILIYRIIFVGLSKKSKNRVLYPQCHWNLWSCLQWNWHFLRYICRHTQKPFESFESSSYQVLLIGWPMVNSGGPTLWNMRMKQPSLECTKHIGQISEILDIPVDQKIEMKQQV